MGAKSFVEKTTFLSLLFLSLNVSADFDWGADGSCEGGNGSFQQQIQQYNGDLENAITVGSIPEGIIDVDITLESDKDVDIRLYGEDGTKIVHWPGGFLNGSGSGSVNYAGVDIEYSGYNGTNGNAGNEYIKIRGTMEEEFVMKAFGYQAGFAEVEYSWQGKSGCTDSLRNSGSFNETLTSGVKMYLGEIPSGLHNAVVFLNANNDLDIELYEAESDEFVVGWRSGRIDSSGTVTGYYKGDRITWSGWNGRHAEVDKDTKSGLDSSVERGREYIRIHGRSQNSYKMYVYAYRAGNAQVEYSWGVNPIYAGAIGMGINFLENDSNDNPYMYRAINGVMPDYIAAFYGASYEGYGHKQSQSDYLANGINLTYATGEGSLQTGYNMKGQPGIAIKLSNHSRGAGDISIFSSGNVQYTYNKLKAQIAENSNNLLFISGHSSGGGDAQDVLWKMDAIGQPVKASYQIDSVETEVSNWGDARIPENTEFGFNYYEDEVWYANWGPREAEIYAENPDKTSIENTYIPDPICDTDGVGYCSEDAHEAIDNDPRVWGEILNSIRELSGIQFGYYD